MGVSMNETDIAFRCNLVYLEANDDLLVFAGRLPIQEGLDAAAEEPVGFKKALLVCHSLLHIGFVEGLSERGIGGVENGPRCGEVLREVLAHAHVLRGLAGKYHSYLHQDVLPRWLTDSPVLWLDLPTTERAPSPM